MENVSNPQTHGTQIEAPEITIESSVPIPPPKMRTRGRSRTWWLLKMAVGQSIGALSQRERNGFLQAAGKLADVKITSAKELDGSYRIWRLK